MLRLFVSPLVYLCLPLSRRPPRHQRLYGALSGCECFMTCIASPLCADRRSFDAVSCHFIVVLMSQLLTRVYLNPFYTSGNCEFVSPPLTPLFLTNTPCICVFRFLSPPGPAVSCRLLPNEVLMKGSKRFGLGPLAP